MFLKPQLPVKIINDVTLEKHIKDVTVSEHVLSGLAPLQTSVNRCRRIYFAESQVRASSHTEAFWLVVILKIISEGAEVYLNEIP